MVAASAEVAKNFMKVALTPPLPIHAVALLHSTPVIAMGKTGMDVADDEGNVFVGGCRRASGGHYVHVGAYG